MHTLKSTPFQILIAVTLFGILQTGCDSNPKSANSQENGEASANAGSAVDQKPIDHINVARQKLASRLWDAAADAAAQQLLLTPDNEEATLIAAKAESGRGNDDLAIQYASEIKTTSRLINESVNIRVEAMYRLRRFADAADLLEESIERSPANWLWRHRAWQLLNRIGRREQASLQAEMLCRAGEATEDELNSLMRRTDAYPTILKDEATPSKWFEPGLGLARWKFTNGDFRGAISLLKEHKSTFPLSPAGEALFGRLLAETQAVDEFPLWHAKTDRSAMNPLGDYWAALGIHFFDKREYQTSARCLLEAIRRNPTDRRTMQRLAKVFDALGKTDQAEQYRRRGVAMAQTEATSDAIQSLGSSENQARLELRKQLMKQTIELERPFESLSWASLVFPTSAVQQQQTISQQRNALLQSADARSMAREAAMIGASIENYSLGDPFNQLIENDSPAASNAMLVEVQPLASPALSNVASEVQLNFQWFQDQEINLASIPIHESIGGGIAIIDYDLDGWPDLYLAQGSGEPPTDQCTRSNMLTRNQITSYQETTHLADAENFHYGSGIAAGDVNQDGWIDLLVGSLGKNSLLINNGDGTFRDATDQLGACSDQFTTSLGIADLDGDSLPDLYEAIYIEMRGAFALPEIGKDGKEVQPSPLEFYAESDRWFRNTGKGSFEEKVIAREDAKPATSLGLMITNFDQQIGNEVFVGNDVRPNHFLRHQTYSGNPKSKTEQTQRLLNSADALGLANGFSGAANGCMGIASADYNRDGRLDLHITNFHAESANLYLQNQSGGFTDFAIRYQLDTTSTPYVGFGTKAIDIDCDGWVDLAVTNGHIFDMSVYGEGFQMPPQLLMNRGTRFELTEVQDDSKYWTEKYLGRSMASLDYNRDGKLDLVVNHLDQPVALLENRTQNGGQSLELELVGTLSERDAIGTRVTVQAEGQVSSSWVTAGDGYLCSDEPVLVFGLGRSKLAEVVTIHWPSGLQQTFENLQSKRYLVVEGQQDALQR